MPELKSTICKGEGFEVSLVYLRIKNFIIYCPLPVEPIKSTAEVMYVVFLRTIMEWMEMAESEDGEFLSSDLIFYQLGTHKFCCGEILRGEFTFERLFSRPGPMKTEIIETRNMPCPPEIANLFQLYIGAPEGTQMESGQPFIQAEYMRATKPSIHIPWLSDFLISTGLEAWADPEKGFVAIGKAGASSLWEEVTSVALFQLPELHNDLNLQVHLKLLVERKIAEHHSAHLDHGVLTEALAWLD